MRIGNIKPGQVDADKAIDGDNNTHWGSSLQDNQWIYVDLGSIHTIGRVVLNWDSSARSYDIEVSDDAEEWKTVYRELNSRGGKRKHSIICIRKIRKNEGNQ